MTAGIMNMMTNTGQSCNAPSRMLVPAAKLNEAERIAASAVKKLIVGDPQNPATTTGPIANRRLGPDSKHLLDVLRAAKQRVEHREGILEEHRDAAPPQP